METNIGNEPRFNGVIGVLDGMTVQKIPANRLPDGFGFLAAHPCATVAPLKLEDYTIHENPLSISGALVGAGLFTILLCWTIKRKPCITRAISNEEFVKLIQAGERDRLPDL